MQRERKKIKNAIAELSKEIQNAIKINPIKLAREIQKIGFKCQLCGQCCKNELADNTVNVFPYEIREIMHNTGLKWTEVATPRNIGDLDKNGILHTFEWILCRDKNKNCKFLRKDNKEYKCTIYGFKPLICQTYPFFIENGTLEVSDCKGLGQKICKEDSIQLAKSLKERYIIEIKESINLLKNFKEFKVSKYGIDIDITKKKELDIIVHDSEGAWKVKYSKGSFYFCNP